jgi:hypothetical protein
MTTTKRTTKAGEITRRITITFALAGRCEARVSECQRGKWTDDVYLLERQTSAFGVAFKVRKMSGDNEGETYDVLLNAPGGGHSCDCKWGTFKSHMKWCRHVDLCLQAVREQKV